MSIPVHAPITETHYQLLRKIYDASLDTKAAVQAIADSEARAVEPMRIVMDVIKESNAVLVTRLEKLASERDTYQREAYHLRKDLCEIAAAFNVGVPDSEEAKKRIIAVKAERDQLHATLERTTIAAAQVADRNVELRAECERMAKQHSTIQAQIELPAAVPRSYMEIAEENNHLRAEVERLSKDVIEQSGRTVKAQDSLEASILCTADQRIRAEKAEVEREQLKESEKILREHHDHHFRRATLAERDAADATARAEKAEAELAQCKNEIATAWKPTLDDHASRALTAETELTKERRRLFHLFHYEPPMAEPGDTFVEWCADIDTAMSGKSK